MKKLTQQQQRRIAQSKAGAVTAGSQGTITAHFSHQWQVRTQDGRDILSGARKNLGKLVVGDQVIWEGSPEEAIIVQRLERKSVLARNPDKPMAANLDQVVVVMAVEPAPIEYYVDQLLVAAELQKLNPIVVLNKCDLAAVDSESTQAIIALYESIGYPVIQTSITQPETLKTLHEQLTGHTSIFVGASGVGKSSLLNALLGEQFERVGDISESNQRGRHTTTTARLYYMDNQTRIIDSPGLREFGIWETDLNTVLAGFKEIRPLLGQCQFRNCQHDQDKGCAIQAALAQEKIPASRWQTVLRLKSDKNLIVK